MTLKSYSIHTLRKLNAQHNDQDFAVALDRDGQDVESRLKKRYDRVLKHTDRLYLVVGKANDVADNVAEASGILDEKGYSSGVVFRLNGSYSGFTNPSL